MYEFTTNQMFEPRRFELNADRTKIRATRGHTGGLINLDAVHTLVTSGDVQHVSEEMYGRGETIPASAEPRYVIHLTNLDSLPGIWTCGLMVDTSRALHKDEAFLYACDTVKIGDFECVYPSWMYLDRRLEW